jgi:hypothetical protein
VALLLRQAKLEKDLLAAPSPPARIRPRRRAS